MWYQLLVCLCIASTIFVGSQGQDPSQVKLVYINQGPIRGHKSPNYDVFEFYNIHYATAPTGVNKFKAPLPPPTWNDTINAVDRGIICPQFRTYANAEQKEDCLVANVFVPDTQNIENCTFCNNFPVLVVVHGGGYQEGYGNEMSPISLVNSKKVIAVTFNYRLGIHGFLCLGTEVAPGNAGMKDQVALLRWVQENIAAFGGNPGNVTIAGCSAGGSSVDTLMLSNTTDGLFHQIITESGCSLAPFAIQMDPLKNAIDHAALLNFTDTNNINALGNFYASLSFENLTTSTQPHLTAGNAGYLVFQPCVEKDLGQERFLVEAPIDILSNGTYTKVPTLYGYADKEGIVRLMLLNFWQNEMNTAFWNFLPVDLKFENEQQRNLVANAAKQFYFNGVVNASKELEFIDYFTDVMFVHSILRVVSLQIEAGNNQVYLYEYGFVHNNSFPLSGDARGAIHCEQMATAFGLVGENPSQELLDMSDKMGEIYLNFIVTGNPTPRSNLTWPAWPPVNITAARTPYYLIRNTTEVVNASNIRPISERAQFWDQIYRDNDIRIPKPPTQNAATLINIISNQMWVAYAIIVLVCFK